MVEKMALSAALAGDFALGDCIQRQAEDSWCTDADSKKGRLPLDGPSLADSP